MSVPARVSLVTLAVADVAASTKFYCSLGWRKSSVSTDDITFLDTHGPVLTLYAKHLFGEDYGINDARGPQAGGVALAINVESEATVDAVISEAVAAGAQLVKAPSRAVWGGYVGYFADPDGHPWEVAHNPGFPLDSSGGVILPH